MAEKKDLREANPQDVYMEINRTRSRINQTVDEIMDRISPEKLKNRAWDEIKSATGPGSRARDTGTNIIDSIRANPVPAIMAGAGLILLFARGSEGRGYRMGTMETTGEKTEEAKQKVYDISHRARGKAEDIRARARDRAGYAKEELGTKAHEVKSVFHDLVQNNPLAVVAAAFVIGSAFGLSVPPTSKERELLGEAGEAMREKAAEKAEEVEKKVSGEGGRAA